MKVLNIQMMIYLSPTAEVPLTFHRNEIIDHKDLPIKYCIFSLEGKLELWKGY